MKKISIVSLLAFLLTACSTSQFHFLDNSSLSLDREKSVITNSRTGVRYPLREEILSPNYTGGYELNFISGEDFSKNYELYGLIKECIKQLPFKQKNVEFVYADKCIVLWLDQDYRSWAPNYTFGEGAPDYIVNKGEWNKNAALTEKTCWRNLLISRSKRRILCVDRVLISSKPAAIVYIMQEERRSLPFPAFYHWHITQPELLPYLGRNLDSFENITRDILEANK